MGMNPANSRLMKCIERLSCGRLLEVTRPCQQHQRHWFGSYPGELGRQTLWTC